MFDYVVGAPGPTAVFLADYYGATDDIQAASTLGELVAALQIVPVTARYGEVQAGQGTPTKADWDEFTARIVLDWTVTENALVYGSFSQGYRPGGINLDFEDPNPLYEPELVDAYELGAKTLWADGSLAVNAALFFNDYQDLQLFGWGTSASAFNEIDNHDAETLGMELEVTWRPLTLPSLRIDLRYAWLDTEIKSGDALDLFDRTQGDPDAVLLRNIDLLTGAPMTNYVAPVSEVLPLVGPASAAGAAIPIPGTLYENGIPVYFSRGFLEANGVTTFNGHVADLDGNELLNSPPHSVGLGIAHTWTLGPGAATLRYDYYWQDSSYSREFNTRGDKIDSWDQHNASLIFESASGRWSVRAWIRNITDEDIVTGHSVAHDQSGNFRNYFMAEPRIYGAAFRYNFGAL